MSQGLLLASVSYPYDHLKSLRHLPQAFHIVAFGSQAEILASEIWLTLVLRK